MHITRTTLVAASEVSFATTAVTAKDKTYKYVIAISVYGFHSSDIGKYVAKRPNQQLQSFCNLAMSTQMLIPQL